MASKPTGAGILPYAFYNNTIYFLVGREHLESGWTGSGKLSDFGGAVESKHKNPADTAASEFWEETMGLFYSKDEVYNLLSTQNDLKSQNGSYLTHLLRIEYNPFWVELFQNAFNYVLTCSVPNPKKQGMQYIPSCPDGWTEKTEIRWVVYTDLKKDVDSNSSLYRPEFIASSKVLFAKKEFTKLLDDASIFIDKNKKGIIVPIVSEPIISTPMYKWPVFYPDFPINPTPEEKPIENSLTYHYSILISGLPFIVKEKIFAQIFNYIDQINQFHYETKSFIVSRATGKKLTEKEILPPQMAYSATSYCPFDVGSDFISKELGSGDYGKVYEATGPMTTCCASPMKLAIKTTHPSAQVDVSQIINQIKDIRLDTTKITDIITSKKTHVYSCEIGALACVKYLVTRSICYNLPYFYGVMQCVTNKRLYMYMQLIRNRFDTLPEDIDVGPLLLQGLYAIRSLLEAELTHGDINTDNLAWNSLGPAIHKRPLYKLKSNQYIIGSPTNQILYLIDFGMGFIKGKLEADERIEKDKSRVNNHINWTPTLQNFKFSSQPHLAYKGYYEPIGKPMLRRQLLDLYLLFSTFRSKFGTGKMIKYQGISEYFMPIFYNPTHFSKTPLSIHVIWDTIFNMLGQIEGTSIIDENALKKLNPNDLVFLGSLPE